VLLCVCIGVQNILFDKFIWYEEYPTVPGSFVLNGFIYALVGLYDLKITASMANTETNASKLFAQVNEKCLNCANMCRELIHL
jgi:hypothetical protein